MEFKVTAIPKIEPIRFNYEELKADISAAVEAYMTLAYTADTIKTAKADRAKLNALKKSLNDERIRLEKEYMEPFRVFKDQVNELVGLVDQAVRAVDAQVKEYEDLQRQEKHDKVMALWYEILYSKYEWLLLQNTWNDKWLNASYSLKQIRSDLEEMDQKISQDLGMLERLPEYSFEAVETYKRSMKVEDALWTVDNLKLMAEEKAKQQAATVPTADEELPGQMKVEEFMAPPVEPEPVQVLRFQCYCTMKQAKALREFMISNGIKFERA